MAVPCVSNAADEGVTFSTNSIPRSKISLRFDLRGYFLASEED